MKQNRGPRRLLGLLLALALCLALAGCGQTSDGLPQPIRGNAVVDQAQVLSDETEQLVSRYSGALEAASGAQIGVLTVTDTGRAKLSDYARDVFNAWGIGDKKKDNGVLLVLVTGGSGNYWCVQGKGLEKALPTGDIKLLLDGDLEPGFAAGDLDGAVQQFTQALAQRMASGMGVVLDLETQGDVTFHPERVSEDTNKELLVMIGAFLILAVMLLCIALLQKPQKRRPGPRPSQASAYAAGYYAASRHSRRSRSQTNIYHAPSNYRAPSSRSSGHSSFGGGQTRGGGAGRG